MNTKQAIEQVLTGKSKGMRVPEIIKAGLPLATGLKGKTPGQTFYSTLYAENKKADGLVTQVSKGTFKLNPKRKRAAAVDTAKAEATPAKAAAKTTRKRAPRKSTKKASA